VNPEDRGPSSFRVAKFDLSNPIHAGIEANPEQNPAHTIRGKGNDKTITSRVQPGSEATPKNSSRYPSFDTETSAPEKGPNPRAHKKRVAPTPVDYKNEPNIEYIPAKKVETKSDAELDKPRNSPGKLKTHGQKLQDKEAARREAVARQNAIAARLKKGK
jgi:hypothetical protein